MRGTIEKTFTASTFRQDVAVLLLNDLSWPWRQNASFLVSSTFWLFFFFIFVESWQLLSQWFSAKVSLILSNTSSLKPSFDCGVRTPQSFSVFFCCHLYTCPCRWIKGLFQNHWNKANYSALDASCKCLREGVTDLRTDGRTDGQTLL